MKAGKQPPIRILIVDDHPIVLSGLRNALAGNPRYVVVAEATNGREAIQKAKESEPDVVLMDISLPMMNGLEATKMLRTILPQTQVLILTMHKNKEYVLETIRAGAQGYILKDTSPNDLIAAIEKVHERGSYFSPSIEQMLLDEVRKTLPPARPLVGSKLSGREQEVLALLAEGMTNREIAQHLQISVRTIETYRKSIMKKLNIFSVAELTTYALDKGLTAKTNPA